MYMFVDKYTPCMHSAKVLYILHNINYEIEVDPDSIQVPKSSSFVQMCYLAMIKSLVKY